MRKVIFGGANSLDNYFARKDGGMDWLIWSDEAMELMKDVWPRFDTIVMGRRTYEHSLKSRPLSNDDGEKLNLFGGIKAYVFSRTLKPGPASGGVEIVSDDPGSFVKGLKAEKGKDICVMGGGDIARSLFESGLIDEIGFNIHPVLLGSGVPLFYEMSRQIDLELLDCKAMKSGCVYVLYRVKH